MEKIYILGNKKNNNKFLSIPQAKCEILPDMIADDCAINDYLVKTFPKDIDKLILYIDETPELVMAIAMHLRLSIFSLKYKSLIPILFVSELSEDSYLHVGVYSQILLTDGIYFCEPNQVAVNISHIKMLTPDKYKSGFVDRISIKPNASVGRHSIANQWGASVLGEVSGLDDKSYSEAVLTARKSLYFKYVYVSAIEDVKKILDAPVINIKKTRSQPILHTDCGKILLIDDEAEKGWEAVLQYMFKDCKFECVSERVRDYDDFSPEARKKIESDHYDLFFLDLRLGGPVEEDVYDPKDFSGMKILKKIKSLNKGNQVIMLTASNKSWNLKALLDAGCDGYYVKESPEYRFSKDFTKKNYNNLLKDSYACLNKKYLKDIYSSIQNINKFLGKNSEDELFSFIIKQLDVAFYLLTLAKTEEQFAHSFFSLYQIFERIIEYNIVPEHNYFVFQGANIGHALDWSNLKPGEKPKTELDPNKKVSEHQKFLAYYFQVLRLNGSHAKNINTKNIKDLIFMRNCYIHNNGKDLNKDIFSERAFRDLFEELEYICFSLKPD